MSGVHVTEDHLRGVWHNSSHDPHFIQLITDYQSFLIKLLGPFAGTLLIQHSGGLDSFVLSSSELSNKVKLHHPALKFVNSLMDAQNSAFSSHGFYVGSLCLHLLKEFIDLEVNSLLPKKIILAVRDEIFTHVLKFLNSYPCNVAAKVDIGCLKDVICFTQSFINRRNLSLSKKEHSHLCIELVKAFLKSVGNGDSGDSFGQVVITTDVGQPTSEAKVFSGVLYKLNDPLTKSLCRKLESSKTHGTAGHLKIILFNIPLSFLKSEEQHLKYSGKESSVAYRSLIIDKLCKFLNISGVELLANQKYIDEEIKFELQRAGILVLERLGTTLAEAVRKLSGCFEVSTIDWLFDEQMYSSRSNFVGTVGSISVVTIGRGKYLHLTSSTASCVTNSVERNPPVVTLLVPILAPALEDNIKVMVENALRNLRLLALQPSVSTGRGCLEACIAKIIHETQLNAQQLDNASQAEINLVKTAFFNVFSKLAIALTSDANFCVYDFAIDLKSGHLFHNAVDQPQILHLNELSISKSYQGRVNRAISSEKCCCRSVGVKTTSGRLISFEDLLKCESKNSIQSTVTLQDSLKEETGLHLDSYSAKINAIKLAFQGASQLFDVAYCIFDR